MKPDKQKPIQAKQWKRRARVVLEWLATPDDLSDPDEFMKQGETMVEEARKLTAHDRPEQP